jgi:branched-chain amino acid transport system substrate-binding protein
MLHLVSADSTSSASGSQLAARKLVTADHVFAVLEEDPFGFGADQFLKQAGVPVVGGQAPGPDWTSPAYKNMFPVSIGNPNVSGARFWAGHFWNMVGAKNVSEVYSSAQPQTVTDKNSVVNSLKAAGISNCVNDDAPLGIVDFTAFVLDFGHAHCDGVSISNILSSSIALGTALRNASLNNVKVLYEVGPDQSITTTAADTAVAQSGFFQSQLSYSTPGGIKLLGELKKYDPAYKGGTPDLGAEQGWTAADLMITGLEAAGTNPTRSSFISGLRSVTNYTAGGVLATPSNYSQQGQYPATQCTFMYQLEGKTFLPFPRDGSPICGTLTASQMQLVNAGQMPPG